MKIALHSLFHWRKTANEIRVCSKMGNTDETDYPLQHLKQHKRSPFSQKLCTRFRLDGNPTPFILVLTLLLVANLSMAQNPGGIITPPALWYSPNGATTTSWTDASSSGLNLTAVGSGGSAAGTVTTNAGDAAHNFNTWTTGYSSSSYYNYLGTNYSVFSNSSTYSPYTIFGVARATSAANGLITGVDDDLSYGAEPGFGVSASGGSLYPRTYRYTNAMNSTANTKSVPLNQTSVYLYQPPYSASNSGTGTLLIGVNGSDTSITGVNAASSAINTRLKIGYDGWTFGAFPGDIQEVVWYKSTLNITDINKVETYLALKSGTTLVHDYVSPLGIAVYSLTTNSGYTSNIAGLGRDLLNGNLDQRQSNSTSTGSQVLISTIGLANTNAANTVDLSTDGQYLVWGDNGLAKTPSIPITGVGAANYRFAAVWTVQNTGSVGTVRVAWPAGLTNLTLLQSSDPTFASGNTTTNMSANTISVNGVTYNYADVILANAQYFTFAATVVSPGGIVTLPAVWYRPDSATTTVWKDASTNGLNLTAVGSGGTAAGTVTTNAGDAAHNFNTWTTGYSSSSYYNYLGTNYSVFSNSSTYSPYTIFGAARATSAANGEITGVDDDLSYGAEPGFGVSASGGSLYPRAYRFTNGMDKTASTKSATLNQTSVYLYQPPYSPTNSGTGTLLIGLNGSDTSITGVNAASSASNTHLKIGYDGWTFGAFPGDIQEVIWYKSTLSMTDINKVETYIALKSGTTLVHDYVAPNGNTIYSLTTNSGYTSNIAGLARDITNGNLDQRQSNSTSTGNQVLISTIGLANNNSSNTTDLSSDGQYLIWGDNGLAKTPNVPITGIGATNYRFGTVWTVQNTGSVGTVRVAWPSGLKNLTLLQSSDPTFTSGNTATDMSANTIAVNGVTYNYADVILANGQYFTFAAQLSTPGGVGAALWFRADIGTNTTTAGTNNLTSWTDINNISTATTTVINTAGGATSYPSYGVTTSYFNFNPYVDFTSTSQSIGDPNSAPLSGASAADQFTVTYSTNYGGSSADNRMFSMNYDPAPAKYDDYTYDYMADNATYFFNRRGAIVSSNPTHAYDNYYTTSTTYRTNNLSNILKYSLSNSATALGIQSNGKAATTIAGNGGTTNLLIPQGGYIMGSLGNSYTNGFGNSIGNVFKSAENILFNRNLNADETQRVNSYLAIRYGITLGGNGATGTSYNYLSSLDNVVWTNDAYHNNVIGIAKDNTSLLQQQISQSSAATPDIITIGTDANSTGVNGSHTAVNADQSFFLVGNDQGSTTTNTPFTYNSSNYNRMTRVWKSQYTNYAQAAYVTVPTANLTTALGTPAAGNAYALVSADDAAFTSNVLVTALTASGANSYGSMAPNGTGTRYFSFALVNSTVLPVTLLDFNATVSNGSVLLDWNTATEINNKGFGIQRSSDNATFTTLAFVGSKLLNGTGTGASYTYTDNTVSSGSYYYRLLQTDLDGKTALSNTVPVYLSGNGDGLKLYPNPVNDVATVAGLEIGKSVVIVSMDGRVVKSFIATSSLQQVYMKGLASGTYILKTTINNKPTNIKFIIK